MISSPVSGLWGPSPAPQGLRSGEHTDHCQPPWNRCGKSKGMVIDVHFLEACDRFGNMATLILNIGNEFIEWSAWRPSRLTPGRYPLHRRLAFVSPTAGTRALEKAGNVEASWNVMAHAQKPHFVFRRNGRVHLNRRGCQFSRLLAVEVCASAVVMLNTPCSEVVRRVLATPLNSPVSPSLPLPMSPCDITFQLESKCKHTITTRSPNQCCRGKAITITHSECVSVALVNQYEKRMRRFILSCGLSGVYHIFPYYLINGMTCGSEVTGHELCVLIFSTTSVWNISHSTKNCSRYTSTYVFM